MLQHWLDLEIVILSEVSQRSRNIAWHLLGVESKIIIQINLFTKEKQTHRLRENELMVARGEGWGGRDS